jgi:colanic acid/amylovoran biosynthesis glycosyltransferase
MKAMTVGLVLSYVPGYSETFFRSKIQGLQAQGIRVMLFVDYPPKPGEDLPCKTIVRPDFSNFSLSFIKDLLITGTKLLFVHPKRSLKLFQLELKQGKPVLVALRSLLMHQVYLQETLDWLHFGFGMLAVGKEQVAEAIGAKMGVSFRGFDLYLSPLKHPNCYADLLKCDVKYHVLSHEMKTDLNSLGVPASKIVVITPAIDTDFFKPRNKAKASSTLQLLTVARLHWKKGLEYTLEALVLLKEKGVDFHYTIIGTGDEYERLAFAVHQLGLNEHVSFARQQSPQAVRQYLENTDIYLQYSLQEGFCNAVLEAQAMGLLCIVSNAEGLQENVLHGQTGWVVPKRQPSLLAEAIIKAINIPESEKETIKQATRLRIINEFGIAQQQAAFFEFFSG